MIISLEGFVRANSYQPIRGEMGQAEPTRLEWNYDKTALWSILIICLCVAFVGLITLIYAAMNNNMMTLTFGFAIFAVGTYQSISVLKEKANLDLLSNHFGNLSESAKNEIMKSLVTSNSSSSNNLLVFIENLFKGKKS